MNPVPYQALLDTVLSAMIQAAGNTKGVAVAIVRDSTGALQMQTQYTLQTDPKDHTQWENTLFDSISNWRKFLQDTNVFCTFIGGTSGDVHHIQQAGYQTYYKMKKP